MKAGQAFSLMHENSARIVQQTIEQIRPADGAWVRRAEERQLQLTKPAGSLGELEAIGNRCAGIFAALPFQVDKPRIVVFAGDHGVCQEGVSAFPQSVTAAMVLNYLHGGAAINCIARSCGVELKIVDVGVMAPLPAVSELIQRRVGPGTHDFCTAPAMTHDETLVAVAVGIEAARQAAADGCHLLGFGEMGIGNTTAASAITAALTSLPAREVVGRGTGADDAMMQRKVAAVERALAFHAGHLEQPMEVLERVGGFEIAAMCGFCLGAAACRLPVVTDGFIATSSAALAVRMQPAVRDYLFVAHASVEPGHRPLADLIGLRPILDLSMRLGEATGAALAMKIIQSAAEVLNGMATFAEAGVAGSEVTGQ
jgi:nicotinate-nucleotide--dimethylbenzimidazole phosphoribosyltransferase